MKILDIIESRRYLSYHDELQQRDRDEQRAMSQGRGEIDDEANLMYVYRDGRLKQAMIDNYRERQAKAEGFRDTQEQALRVHNIIRSKFNPKKWVQKQGTQWVEVFPFGKPEGLEETATAGSTSAGNVAVGAVYKNKPAKQAKNKDGTAKNALDMKANLLTGGSIKR